jgi:hypothetical protein
MSVSDDGKSKGDAIGWRFRRVGDWGDPSVCFIQQGVSWKERAGVAVRTHAEEQEIEYGDFDGGFICKDSNEFLLVCVGEFLWIRDEALVDMVDLLVRDEYFGEEMIVTDLVI